MTQIRASSLIEELQEHAEEILAALDEVTRSGRWWARHSRELKEQYPDEWIAILECAVIAHEGELSILHNTLADMGLLPGDVLIEYMEHDPAPMVL